MSDENSSRVLDQDCPRRELQSAFQRGIDNLFNRVRQLEIVDVKRKASIDGHEKRLAKLEGLIKSKAILEAENAAPESKAGDEAYVNNLRADNRKMALSNAGMTMKIAELERQLMAYRDCANCAESPVPTKRQQVAEAFLHAALLCPDGSETTYANLAYILATPESPYHNNTTRDMASVLHNEWKSGNNNE